MKEEIGTKKGEFLGQYVITHVRPHAKSYFCKDMETGHTYLCNQDHIKLDPDYIKPEVELKTVKLISDCIPVPQRGILKKPNSRRISFPKNVSFNATFYTARIVAKQSIKEWKQGKA